MTLVVHYLPAIRLSSHCITRVEMVVLCEDFSAPFLAGSKERDIINSTCCGEIFGSFRQAVLVLK
jgi:hypothetical protein